MKARIERADGSVEYVELQPFPGGWVIPEHDIVLRAGDCVTIALGDLKEIAIDEASTQEKN